MITFRIDDIGASTKKYNQHGKKRFYFKKILFFYFPFANFWFFKRIWPFKRWAVYQELTAKEWKFFLDLFGKNNIKPIVAITACWVNKNGHLIPFSKKFPQEASVLKKAVKDGKIIIANHGLTHCVVEKHLPNFWSANRKYHREFWPWLPQSLHDKHIVDSQRILENYFEQEINIFVPPGNVWSYKTYRALKKTNIDTVISHKYILDSNKKMDDITFVDDKKDFFLFHDKELKEKGKKWLEKKIYNLKINNKI